jgi:hypothetical protein
MEGGRGLVLKSRRRKGKGERGKELYDYGGHWEYEKLGCIIR